MEPLFEDGELLLINPRAYAKRRPCVDDIVVCRHPHKSIDVVKHVADVDEKTVALHSPGGTDSRQFGRPALSEVRGQVTVSLTRLRRVHSSLAD